MADNNQLKNELIELINFIDKSLTKLEQSLVSVQDEMTIMLQEQAVKFEITGGKYVRKQKIAARINTIEKKLNEILTSEKYTKSIVEYLDTFKTIEERNVAMQKTFNQVKVDTEQLSPARKFVLEQTEYYLQGAGLNENYVQPAKYLMMQQVTSGASIEDSKKMIDLWGKGKLSDGDSTMGRETPSLNQYGTQMARDTSYQYNGVVNKIIRDVYKLDGFIYVGNKVKHSRPLCVHLVDENREIMFSELPELLIKYPEGVIPGTTQDNFIVYRGGYGCRHLAMAVRIQNE